MQHSAGKPDNSAVRPDNRTFCPKTGLSGLKPDTWQPYPNMLKCGYRSAVLNINEQYQDSVLEVCPSNLKKPTSIMFRK